MLSVAGMFVAAVAAFVATAALTSLEERRGRRLVAPRVRRHLDVVVYAATVRLHRAADYVGRGIIQFTWYYSVSKCLRGFLHLLENLYLYLDRIMRAQRKRAKRARKPLPVPLADSHLTHLADHKVASSLTPEERERRRAEHLEGS